MSWHCNSKSKVATQGFSTAAKCIDEQKFIVGGYQADIDFTNKFAGILYEEKGRGILATRGEQTTIAADGKKSKQRFAEAEGAREGHSSRTVE